MKIALVNVATALAILGAGDKSPPISETVLIRMRESVEPPTFSLPLDGPIKSKNKRARREARGWK